MAIRLVIDRDGLFDFKNCSRHRLPSQDDDDSFGASAIPQKRQSRKERQHQRKVDCQRMCFGVLPGYCFVMHHDCLQWNHQHNHNHFIESVRQEQPHVNIEQPSLKRLLLEGRSNYASTSIEECSMVVQTLDWDDIGCTLMPNAPADCTKQLKQHVAFECVTAAPPPSVLHN